MNTYYHMKYVMSFLMAFNESFAQIRGKILLTDPNPPINKVFSLISREEKQKAIRLESNSNTVDPFNNLAFVVRNDVTKRTSYHTSYHEITKDRNETNLHAHIVTYSDIL